MPVWLLIVLLAMPSAMLAGALAQFHESIVFRSIQFPFDHIAYVYEGAVAYKRLGDLSATSIALGWFHTDIRGVLLQMLMLFLFPAAFSIPFGYQIVTIPVFAVGVAALGWFAYGRSRSIVYAWLAMAAFCFLPFIFVWHTGLGVFLPDIPAAMMVLTAGCLLLLSERGRKLEMIAGFAICAAVAINIRYVSALYTAAMFGPLVFAYALLRAIEARSWKPAAELLALVGGIIIFVSGIGLALRFIPVIGMYASEGAVAFPIDQSADWYWKKFKEFYGDFWIVGALALIFALNVLLAARRSGWAMLLETAWPAIAHTVVMIFVLRVVGHETASYYAFPFVFLFAVGPMQWAAGHRRLRWAHPILCSGLLAVMGLGVSSYNQDIATAKALPDDFKIYKNLAVDLGDRVAHEGDKIVWATFFDHFVLQAALEAYFETGILSMGAGEDPYFHTRDAPLRHLYEGKTPEEAAQSVIGRINKYVDLVVVLEDPDTAATELPRHAIDSPYSIAIARDVARFVEKDPGWQRAFELDKTPYGRLAAYRNIQATKVKDAYDRRLRAEILQ